MAPKPIRELAHHVDPHPTKGAPIVGKCHIGHGSLGKEWCSFSQSHDERTAVVFHLHLKGICGTLAAVFNDVGDCLVHGQQHVGDFRAGTTASRSGPSGITAARDHIIQAGKQAQANPLSLVEHVIQVEGTGCCRRDRITLAPLCPPAPPAGDPVYPSSSACARAGPRALCCENPQNRQRPA